jgi:hypothetical protein
MRYPHAPGFKTLAGRSRQAARSIAPHARTLRDRVLAEIEHAKSPPTADEIASGLGENILSVRPRVSELYRLGRIEPAPVRGKNASGMSAMRWRLAPIAPDLFKSVA